MKVHTNNTMFAALVLAAMCVGGAKADLALAELTSITVRLSGPGLGFLSAGPESHGTVTLGGHANGVADTYVSFWYTPFFSDQTTIAGADGGASFYVGGVAVTAPSQDILLTIGHVRAMASSGSAGASLTTSVFFDIVGIPPAGSTITITPTLGEINFIEQTPPNAVASLFASVSITKYVAGDPSVMNGVSDVKLSASDSFALAPFTIDLSDNIVDPVISISAMVDATASVGSVPEPGTLILFWLGGVLLCGWRYRRNYL